MLKARKANRVIRIPDEKKDVYIKLGYTITDMDDNIVHEHVEPTQRLKDLEAENEALKAENVALKEKLSQNETASEPVEEKSSAKKSTKDAAK